MKRIISLLTLLCLALGILSGLFLKPLVTSLSFIGTIYINLLKFLIGPIVFSSIVPTIYASSKKKDATLRMAILTYMAMFIATFLLTSLAVTLLDPAKGFTFPAAEWNGQTQSLSVQEIIINLFPNNLVSIFAETKLFAIILFAYMLGLCAGKVKDGDKLIKGIEILRDVFFRILEYIMVLTPLAVFALIGNTVASYGLTVIGVGLRYIATAYLCGLITVAVVMILPVWVIAGISPLQYLKKVYKVWLFDHLFFGGDPADDDEGLRRGVWRLQGGRRYRISAWLHDPHVRRCCLFCLAGTVLQPHVWRGD